MSWECGCGFVNREEMITCADCGFEKYPERFDSTSPMVTIKGAWKGIEIVILNTQRRGKGNFYDIFWFFAFIPLVAFSIILMLSPLEKSSEGEIYYMVLYVPVILVGIIFMLSLIFKLIGKKHIFIKDNTLIIKKQIHDFGIPFKYKIQNISKLYMSNPDGAPYGYNIKFDYKGESYLLVDFLEETEAKSIITELQKHIDISPFKPS